MKNGAISLLYVMIQGWGWVLHQTVYSFSFIFLAVFQIFDELYSNNNLVNLSSNFWSNSSLFVNCVELFSHCISQGLPMCDLMCLGVVNSWLRMINFDSLYSTHPPFRCLKQFSAFRWIKKENKNIQIRLKIVWDI